MKRTTLNKAIYNAIFASAIIFGTTSLTFAENNQNSTAISQAKTHSDLGFELIKTQINKSPNDKAIYQGIQLKNVLFF